MALSKQYLRTFIGTKAFYRSAIAVMIPVIIQQLINTLFNVVDNAMVGAIDGLNMTAASTANKPFLIYTGFIFGITGGGSILISQYFGANDSRQCQRIFSLEMALCFVLSLIVCAILYFFPGDIIRIFIEDPVTIDLAVSYLKLVCFSYIPVAVSSTCIFSMRSLGKNKVPMMASIFAMCANALFNYIFIFGHFGAPAMGIEGAALGTLLSRLLEMLFYLYILARKKAFFTLNLFAFVKLKAPVLKSFIKRAMPLTLNEILWTVGINIYAWAYLKIDESANPALVIAELTMQIGMVLSMGMSSAISVLIGTELGANRLSQAKSNAKKLLTLVCGIALISAAVACIGAFILPNLFQVAPHLKSLATNLTLIFAAFYLANAVYGFCFFCMRAGGDTLSATLLDSGYMWLIPVPASFLLVHFGRGRVSLMLAVLVIQFLMNAKAIPALFILRRGRWVKNITINS